MGETYQLTDRQRRSVRRFIYRTLHARGIEAEVTATPTSITVVPLLEWTEVSNRGEDGVMTACLSVARAAVSRIFNVRMIGHHEYGVDGYPREYAHICGVPLETFNIEVCVSPIEGECNCDY